MTERCVVFDWGGVILRIARSFQEGCQAAGLTSHPDITDEELYTVRRSHSLAYQVGDIDDKTFFAAVSEATAGRYNADDIRLIHDAWLLEEYAGVDKLIDRLNQTTGVSTGMLSNTNARHWQRRGPSDAGRAFPTAGRITHAHASHLLGFAKPDPAIYDAFQAVTGYKAAAIIFFDDLQENIDAARSKGWDAIHIDHTADTAEQMTAALVERGLITPTSRV